MSHQSPEHQSSGAKKSAANQSSTRSTLILSSPASILQRAQVDPTSLTPGDVLQLQRTIGNQATGRLLAQQLSVQTKLQIGPANDKYEQEADAAARQVVRRMAAPPVQRDDELGEEIQAKSRYDTSAYTAPQSAPVKRAFVAPKVQREELDEEMAQAAPSHGLEGGEVEASVAQTIQRAQGGGNALDAKTRNGMEGAFGADFGGVRVHTDAQADTLNRSLNARAFTTGKDIFFRSGEYNPGSSGGKELLAHELTHTVQQGAAQRVPDSQTSQLRRVFMAPQSVADSHRNGCTCASCSGLQRSIAQDASEGSVQRLIDRAGLIMQAGAPQPDKTYNLGIKTVTKRMSKRYHAVLDALDIYHNYINTTNVLASQEATFSTQANLFLDGVGTAALGYVNKHTKQKKGEPWRTPDIQDIIDTDIPDERSVIEQLTNAANGHWTAFLGQSCRNALLGVRALDTAAVVDTGTNAVNFAINYSGWLPPKKDAFIDAMLDANYVKGAGLYDAINNRGVVDSAIKANTIFAGLKIFVDNNDSIAIIPLNKIEATVMAIYSMGRSGRNRAPYTDKENFATEVLGLTGWLGGAIGRSFGSLDTDIGGTEVGNVKALYTLPSAPSMPSVDKELDEGTLRNELPLNLLKVLSKYDPGKFESVSQSLNPTMQAKADLIHRTANQIFPHTAQSSNTISQMHHGWKYSEKITDLETEDVSGSRMAYMQNRARMSEVGVLGRVNFKNNREADTLVLTDVLTEMLKEKSTQELVDRHLRGTSRADGANTVHVQTVLQKRGDGNDAIWNAQWQMIHTLCHELLHVLVHPSFSMASRLVEDSLVVSEGFVEVLGVELYNHIVDQATNNLTFQTELIGGLAKPDVPPKTKSGEMGYGAASQKALQIRNKVGDTRFKTAFFLGRPELVGIG